MFWNSHVTYLVNVFSTVILKHVLIHNFKVMTCQIVYTYAKIILMLTYEYLAFNHMIHQVRDAINYFLRKHLYVGIHLNHRKCVVLNLNWLSIIGQPRNDVSCLFSFLFWEPLIVLQKKFKHSYICTYVMFCIYVGSISNKNM